MAMNVGLGSGVSTPGRATICNQLDRLHETVSALGNGITELHNRLGLVMAQNQPSPPLGSSPPGSGPLRPATPDLIRERIMDECERLTQIMSIVNETIARLEIA